MYSPISSRFVQQKLTRLAAVASVALAGHGCALVGYDSTDKAHHATGGAVSGAGGVRNAATGGQGVGGLPAGGSLANTGGQPLGGAVSGGVAQTQTGGQLQGGTVETTGGVSGSGGTIDRDAAVGCADGETRCDGTAFLSCVAGWWIPQACNLGLFPPCNTGVCDPELGCTTAPLPDDTGCSDSNLCTRGDACVAGTCQGGTELDCSAAANACNTGTCEPSTGQCVAVPVAVGAPCNDARSQCDGRGQCAPISVCNGGDVCSETCNGSDGDCTSDCGAGQQCTLACNNRATCSQRCLAAATCNMVCGDADDCDMVCDGGSACSLQCAGGSYCEARCNLNSACGEIRCSASGCRVRCENQADCQEVHCDASAQCVMLCEDASACDFATCIGTRRDCGGGIVTCNSPCP